MFSSAVSVALCTIIDLVRLGAFGVLSCLGVGAGLSGFPFLTTSAHGAGGAGGPILLGMVGCCSWGEGGAGGGRSAPVPFLSLSSLCVVPLSWSGRFLLLVIVRGRC